MKKDKILILGIGLVVLLGAAYAASSYNGGHKAPVVSTSQDAPEKPFVVPDDSIKAEFTHIAGWTEVTGSNYFRAYSPDLKYACSDGEHTYKELEKIAASISPEDSDPGPCFRSPISKGSDLVIVNQGDMGLAGYTLDNIPNNFTDGNQGNTIKNVRNVKVDGYDAVRWEDSYGDNPISNSTVAIIKDHGIYMIRQSWAPQVKNPYPDLMDKLIASFKFTS